MGWDRNQETAKPVTFLTSLNEQRSIVLLMDLSGSYKGADVSSPRGWNTLRCGWQECVSR